MILYYIYICSGFSHASNLLLVWASLHLDWVLNFWGITQNIHQNVRLLLLTVTDLDFKSFTFSYNFLFLKHFNMFKMLIQMKLETFHQFDISVILNWIKVYQAGFYWLICSTDATDVKNCSIHHNRDRIAVAGSFLNDTKMKAKERLGKTGKFPLCKWFKMFPWINNYLNCLLSLSETRLPAIPFTEHSPRLSKPFNALYGTQAMVWVSYLSKF